MSNPIPVRDRPAFLAWMRERDVVPAPRREWHLLEAAEEFMLAKRYARGDPQTAVDVYERLSREEKAGRNATA